MGAAGSGKTRVLVDRVIRLLLAGAEPQQILCITYTKAAAAEMQERLFKTLGEWATSDDTILTRELAKLKADFGGDAEALRRARALFARALETPGGLRIQTFHSFCEKLLRRFPLEAGMAPGFELMSDRQTAMARQLAENRLIANADEAMQRALDVAFALGGEGNFTNALQWFGAHRHAINARDAHALEEMQSRLADWLGIDGVADNVDDIAREFCDGLPVAAMERAASLMLGSETPTYVKMAEEWLAVKAMPPGVAQMEAYARSILTGEGKPLAAVFNGLKKVKLHEELGHLYQRGTSDDGSDLGEEFKRLFAAQDQIKSLDIYALNAALYRLGLAYLSTFEAVLRARNWIDYDDLIEHAADLLMHNEARDWVRYKLDGGIAHILVDEAQDSNERQWDIVDAFSEEFLAGQGAQAERRALAPTVFAVGDEKQSIFSFQGASPETYRAFIARMNNHAASRSNIKVTSLPASFRSSQAVLNLVDEVFHPERLELLIGKSAAERAAMAADPDAHDDGLEDTHAVLRQDYLGRVDVLPGFDKPKSEKSFQPVYTRMADALVKQIQSMIADRTPVFSKAGAMRAMGYGDVLILVRKRSGITPFIISALHRAGLPIAGRDRLKLSSDPAVKDCLTLARACLNPDDDLSVAELAMSPLCHPTNVQAPPLSYEALAAFRLAALDRPLWRVLLADDSEATAPFRDLFNTMRPRAMLDTPFEFFARLLSQRSETGESWAARLYARLGQEAAETLEAFLGEALAHEQEGAFSLERFVHEQTHAEAELKRQLEGVDSAIRIMTVHGAKGLEAPVVFLPCLRAESAKQPLALETDGGPVFHKKEMRISQLDRELERHQQASEAEDLRLLYVAMTRARDHLVVLGMPRARDDKGKPLGRPGWFEFIQEAAAKSENAIKGEDGHITIAPGGVQTAPTSLPASPKALSEPPLWLEKIPPAALGIRSFQAAGQLGRRDQDGKLSPVGVSPFAAADDKGRLRGVIIHKLLELLPAIPADGRRNYASRFLAQQRVGEGEGHTLLDEVFAVLEHPEMRDIFGADSRAEVPLIGRLEHWEDAPWVSGRVDRLVVTRDEVHIVDFKSDRPPPESVEGVELAYRAQLAAYGDLLRQVHPDKHIRASLIWTWNASIMEIPQPILSNRGRLTQT
jgi:ATP-dependent helicase/nuclease subunit A